MVLTHRQIFCILVRSGIVDYNEKVWRERFYHRRQWRRHAKESIVAWKALSPEVQGELMTRFGCYEHPLKPLDLDRIMLILRACDVFVDDDYPPRTEEDWLLYWAKSDFVWGSWSEDARTQAISRWENGESGSHGFLRTSVAKSRADLLDPKNITTIRRMAASNRGKIDGGDLR